MLSERKRLERLEKSVEEIRIGLQKLLEQSQGRRQHKSRRDRRPKPTSPPPSDVLSKGKGNRNSYACNTGLRIRPSGQEGRGPKFVEEAEPIIKSQAQLFFMSVDSHDDEILTSIAELMQTAEDWDHVQTESKACGVVVEILDKNIQNHDSKVTEIRREILDINHSSKSQMHQNSMQQESEDEDQQESEDEETQKLNNMELANIILVGNRNSQSWQHGRQNYFAFMATE
ncbi:PREDICTED: uncharacterized protein LOC105967830, partial [Erythranthe guttata]|uniref:uncharacterized protein LOC105967830 n=1 Tax=Erythranthe guttata TaxID=4155 RepID=UPI00064D7509